MNKAKLKSYAPQARKDFIAAVTARANLLGLSDKAGALEVAPAQTQGDVTVIAGQAWPAKVSGQRDKLIERIRKDGFAQTMEAVAYTWFNRFAALRYMELHDYLGHGHRALSSVEGALPNILTHATDLAQSGGLPGLKLAQVTEMKLAGNRDGELYRMLLVAQCNALSRAMPFLFERIDDDSELLLPDNLLRSDSVIAKLVEAIPEEDWAEVEIIGWLYQFYISEKKDQVIGKVVKSEDIPAATQLFTPNWIVQYLVQNSVGRLWLMANPQSTLASQWPYYIAPAEQTPEVQAQLDALIQTRIAEDFPRPLGEGLGVRAGGSLNPESITVLDPACGSGHILVVAYDVLKAIYLERGYRVRDIPRLILEKNLFGLDIDDRAAQMAGFALLMKARADDRRLFNEPIQLNVLALQESRGLDAESIFQALQNTVGRVSPQGVTRQPNGEFGDSDLFPGTRPQMNLGESVMSETSGYAALTRPTVAALIDTFEHAKTFGSLIQIPYALKTHLAVLPEVLALVKQSGDMYATAAADDLLPLVQQAQVLAMQFDAVVANPPYMGGKGMNPALKDYAKATFPDSKSDLFAMFMERGFDWCKPSCFNSMVTMQSWMFLSSYESMRERLLRERAIQTMAQLGARAFGEISGEVVQTTAFVLHGQHFDEFKPVFFRLVEGQEEQKETALLNGENRYDTTVQDDFGKIPGSPLVYWLPGKLVNLFNRFPSLDAESSLFKGLSTGENERYIRFWFEVNVAGIYFDSKSLNDSANSSKKWYPCNKGGGFRKWFGNRDAVIDWQRNGSLLRSMVPKSVIRSPENYFLPCLSWSKVSSGGFSMRYFGGGFVPLDSSSSLVSKDRLMEILSLVNSKPFAKILAETSPTLNFEIAQIGRMPDVRVPAANDLVSKLIAIHKADWESNENDWAFAGDRLVSSQGVGSCIENAWNGWKDFSEEKVSESVELETSNNRLFINAYGLQDELSPEVPESQITLARADREKDCQRLISYAIGCMMGRYSLDEPGLIYAHAGSVGFEPGRYATFPADADGIVPITDELWFEGDAASRIPEFLLAVWGDSPSPQPSPQRGEGVTTAGGGVQVNMTWLAESLGTKASETPDETIRRYIADKFFKDHLQTYKKRPIYWLFSSGKQGAFQALVYLHRYHEGTLARLRAEYVVPLTGKIQSRIEMLQKDANAASSTAARNKLGKEVEKLKKKHVELLAYDEQLRHHADMRITLDLDDGVKVNYGKFGDLLAEVKAVTGGKDEE